jgi:hypothetical protein
LNYPGVRAVNSAVAAADGDSCHGPQSRDHRRRHAKDDDGGTVDDVPLWGEAGSHSYFDLDDQGRLALYVPSGSRGADDGEIRIWPTDQAGEPRPVSIPGGRSGWLAWAADGRLLVANQGQLAAWDVDTGAKSLDFPGKIGRAAIAPSREWFVAAVNNDHLEVFDVCNAKSLGRLAGAGR